MKILTLAESRPLRGAEIVEKGGSSASARLKLEADKRGSPLDVRSASFHITASRSPKSGDFFGLRGEKYIFEREGDKPLFARKTGKF